MRTFGGAAEPFVNFGHQKRLQVGMDGQRNRRLRPTIDWSNVAYERITNVTVAALFINGSVGRTATTKSSSSSSEDGGPDSAPNMRGLPNSPENWRRFDSRRLNLPHGVSPGKLREYLSDHRIKTQKSAHGGGDAALGVARPVRNSLYG